MFCSKMQNFGGWSLNFSGYLEFLLNISWKDFKVGKSGFDQLKRKFLGWIYSLIFISERKKITFYSFIY